MKLAFALLLAVSLTAQVRLARNGEQVDVTINGKPFTALYFGADSPKPYLHPLRTVTGVIVTEVNPADHPHHRGLWFTHGDVNGVNLWAEGPGMGKVVLTTLGKLISGPDTGSLTAEFRWQGPDGKPILDESRRMTFTQIGNENIIDFEATLKPVGAEKVVLGDTKEGMFAIRLLKPLTANMTSSEGAHGMAEIWGKRASWVDYAGVVDDQKIGVAIFDSPKNPKHPAYWHARDYGLFAVNQFGEHDYYNDKSRNGSVTIEPGKSLTFKYRVIIHPGDAITSRLAAQYSKWSEKQ